MRLDYGTDHFTALRSTRNCRLLAYSAGHPPGNHHYGERNAERTRRTVASTAACDTSGPSSHSVTVGPSPLTAPDSRRCWPMTCQLSLFQSVHFVSETLVLWLSCPQHHSRFSSPQPRSRRTRPARAKAGAAARAGIAHVRCPITVRCRGTSASAAPATGSVSI
jgi:hypothetical protein